MEMSESAKKIRREYMRKWRQENKDRIKDYHKKWRENNPEKVAEAQVRYWANKAKNIS